MHKSILASVALLVTMGIQSAEAARVLRVLERGHETSLTSVVLPRSSSGSVLFRPCASCDQEAMRVTGATQYRLNDQNLTLEQLRDAVATLRSDPRAGEGTLVGIIYSVDSNQVTKIVMVTHFAR